MYAHYPSKEALLFAIAIDGHRDVLSTMRAADDPARPAMYRLRAVVAGFTSWQARNHKLARVVQYELRALSPPHYRAVTAIRRKTTETIRTIVSTGMDTGEFRVDAPDDIVLAVSSLCVDVCRWFPGRDHRDPDALAEAYAELAARLLH